MSSWRKTLRRKRRNLFTALTRRIERTRLPVLDGKERIVIRRVLVIRPNHRLGNQLLITPLLQELEQVLPEATVDVWVKGGVAPLLFREYKQIDRITLLPKKPIRQLGSYARGWLQLRSRRYDLVINVVNHSSSGKVSTNIANARFRFLGEIDDDIRRRHSDHAHIAKYPVYSFRCFIRRLGFPVNDEPVLPLSLRLTPEEIDNGKEILYSILKDDRKTLAIYTFATGDKMYPVEWWDALYTRLKATYPEHNILEVLPVENVSQIGFKAPAFYSKDLRAIGGVIANTQVFIGADSGMMHLAAATGTPTIGLFNADNMPTYEPYGNGSLGLHIKGMNHDAIMDAVANALRR